uniref:Bm171 n=1 Tax=Brugia malayi TaxID=6279 RepID=A0A1I9FZY9_BRUMA|nr:Bm171 [Brugia malayi]
MDERERERGRERELTKFKFSNGRLNSCPSSKLKLSKLCYYYCNSY